MTEEMLEHFVAFAPSDSAVYEVADGGSLETLYLSEGVPALLDMTREEYLEITERDAMELTLPADRPGLQAATANCVKTGKPFDYFYRVFHKTKGFAWVHVHAHVCGTMNGRMLILALFANMTAEGGIYQQILDASDRQALVIDLETYDILYANALAATDNKGKARSLLDQKCYTFMHGYDAPCEHCSMRSRSNAQLSGEVRFDEGSGKWQEFTRRIIEWCDHPAALVYIKDVTAERTSEIAVERYRQMYADATQEAKLIVWTYDTRSHEATMLWDGYTKEVCEKLHVPQIIENAPENLAKYVDPRDRSAFVQMYRDMDDGARRSSCEFRFQMPGQELQQYERAIASAIFDESGRKIGIYCFGQNITTQKREEEKYHLAFEELGKAHLYSLGSYRLNLTKDTCVQEWESRTLGPWPSGKVDDFFAALCELINDDEKKREFSKLFGREILLDAFAKGTDRVSLEYPFTGVDGVRHWREGLLFMMRNPKTEDVEAVTYAMDIDEQKQSEFVLQKLIHENFDYVGIIHPKQSTFEFVSRSSWIGYGSIGEQLDYRKCCDYVSALFVDEGERRRFEEIISIDHIVHSLEKGNGRASETYFRSNGKTACAHLVYHWLEQPGGDILVVRSDTTDSYEQEQKYLAQMRKALDDADRANEAKSAFLSTMSHDLRTPLNGVLGFTDFALAENDPEKKQEYLRKIKHSGDLLLNLVNDTLELSRIESGKAAVTPEVVLGKDVGPSVIDALRPTATAKGVTLEAENFPDGYIYVDKLKFQKIWLNLLSNAIRYTPAGGTVRACVESIDPPEQGRNCRLVVEDTGIGMSEEFMKRMFEPFSQENRSEEGSASGTGLGLSIVKRIVDLLGGTISVRSEIDKGTRFEVDVPVSFVDGPEVVQRPVWADDDLSGKRVLLCEDSQLNREIVETLLRNRGIEFASAENGAVGLDLFVSSAPGTIDAILMDLRMPVMDGYEATKAIRSLDRADAQDVPIIALTADAFEESTKGAASAGMNAHLTKPIAPEKFYATLSELIGSRGQTAE